MSEIVITSGNFEAEVLKSQKPVLVDFWADWCGPCKMLAPVVDALADEFADSITVGKVNVDEEQDLAGRFSVMSIPTLILFKDGEAVAQTAGFQPQRTLSKWIKENM